MVRFTTYEQSKSLYLPGSSLISLQIFALFYADIMHIYVLLNSFLFLFSEGIVSGIF